MPHGIDRFRAEGFAFSNRSITELHGVFGLFGNYGHGLTAPNLASSIFACQSLTAIRGRSCRLERRASIVASRVEQAQR